MQRSEKRKFQASEAAMAAQQHRLAAPAALKTEDTVTDRHAEKHSTLQPRVMNNTSSATWQHICGV